MVARPPRVYLHVGLPKTGTTYLQELLWRNRAEAAEAGLLYPGYVVAAHFHAAVDLQRQRYLDWVEPLVTGAWERLVEQIRGWPERSLISSEILATATSEVVEQAKAALAFAEVHVVCTARDLARQVPSVWQENIKTRQDMTFTELLAALRTGEPAGMSEEFWEFQDLLRVLRTWAVDLPPEHVHVVTVPPRGAAQQVLWRRFCATLEVDADRLIRPASYDNRSLGMAETELLRRLNRVLEGQVDWPRYAAVVKEQLAEEVLPRRSGGARVPLPAGELPWLRRQADRVIAEIDEAGYDVVGDLDDLRPTRPADPPAPRTVEPTDGEVLEAAVDALAELVQRVPKQAPGHSGDRVRRALRELSEQHPQVMALRRIYWKGKAQFSRGRGDPPEEH